MSYPQSTYNNGYQQQAPMMYGQPQPQMGYVATQPAGYAQPGYAQPGYSPQSAYPPQQVAYPAPQVQQYPPQQQVAYPAIPQQQVVFPGPTVGQPMVAPNAQVIAGGNTLTTTGDFLLAKRVQLGAACVPVAKFDVYDASTSADSSKFLIKDFNGNGAFMTMKDETECPAVCCSDNIRAYRYSTYDKTTNQILSRVEKECQFPACLCLCRPEFDIKDGQGRDMAHVVDKFNCCKYELELTNAPQGPFRIDGTGKTLTLEMDYCQCGVLMPCCCGPCREANFQVRDGNDQLYAQGTKINNCMSNICDEMGTTKVKFAGTNNHPGEKEKRLAVLNMVAMMEKIHFSESKSNNGGNNNN